MALNKLKFSSINVTPVANQAIKFNSSANGFETGSAGGAVTFIKKLTASSSSTLSFVDGSSDVVLDNTYKEYLFTFKNIHASAASEFQVNFSTDTGSNYNVTKTTNVFYAYHKENGASTTLTKSDNEDLQQSTAFQNLTVASQIGLDADECASGQMHLFNPSSTTFVKHFISRTNYVSNDGDPFCIACQVAGYCNTTSAIDAVQFKMASGNIDAGDICLYGIN